MFIKREQLSAKWKRVLNLQENPEKKRQAEKRRCGNKKESVKQYKLNFKYCK